MAADAAVRFNLDPQQNEEAILSAEGIEAFKRILASGLKHVIVSTRDFNALLGALQRAAPNGDSRTDSKLTPAERNTPARNYRNPTTLRKIRGTGDSGLEYGKMFWVQSLSELTITISNSAAIL